MPKKRKLTKELSIILFIIVASFAELNENMGNVATEAFKLWLAEAKNETK